MRMCANGHASGFVLCVGELLCICMCSVWANCKRIIMTGSLGWPECEWIAIVQFVYLVNTNWALVHGRDNSEERILTNPVLT